MPLGPMKTKKQKRRGMKKVMDEFESGKLRSGSKKGPKVRNPKQAIAIGLNQTGQGRGGKKPKKMAAAPKRARSMESMSAEEIEKKYGDRPIGGG